TRISDLREEMKSGQEILSTRISDLREEMKSGQESLAQRIDDSNSTMLVLFTSLIALIAVLFGYLIWDRRTMMKPVAEKLQSFEHQVVNDLDLNHSDGSLVNRQLKVMKKYAGRNTEFAEVMRGEALL
ncbi:MAG: hypothetical protein HQK66_10075, partial [Desulfamplus sp.]|nr:hypothetical protein [Desulfamplus sp.]